MGHTKSGEFWVIFDTCTRVEYYKDLHAILALPEGWIVRYEYEKKLLTPLAIARSDEFDHGPTRALLVYGQFENYKQGDDESTFAVGTPRLWVATRFAKVIRVIRDSNKYHYDLKLAGYPNSNQAALGGVLSSVETPFNKWVAVSDKAGDLKAIETRSNADADWDNIVAWFHQNSQFANDTFWRLVGPCSHQTKQLMAVEDRRGNNGSASTVVPVYDGDRVFFTVTVRDSPTSGRLPTSARMITCDVDSESNIELEANRIAIRPYCTHQLNVRVHSDSVLRTRETRLKLSTTPQGAAYISGPSLEIVFALRRSASKIAIGVLSGLVSAAMGFVAMQYNSLDVVYRLYLFLGSVIFGVIATLLLKKEKLFK